MAKTNKNLSESAGEIIGRAIVHDSAHMHVQGNATYIDDMPVLPGALELVLVTSPHAHAKIISIDII